MTNIYYIEKIRKTKKWNWKTIIKKINETTIYDILERETLDSLMESIYNAKRKLKDKWYTVLF